MALDVLHKTLLYAVTLLVAKHPEGSREGVFYLKSYLEGYVKIS